MTKHMRRKVGQRSKNNYLWLWILAVLGIAGLAVIWFRSQPATASGSYPLELSVEDAAAKQEAGAFMLDVRQPEEWNEYHIPGSTLIPLGELASRLNELPRDREIVVVCRSGNRSAQGRDILLDADFTQVSSMAGGLTQWRASGYPTVSGP